MQVILLEKITNLGNLGEQVKVKAGYARNFLLPQGKALPATADNLVKFEKVRAEFEKKAQDILTKAQTRAEALAKLAITIPVNVSEEGKLFGSVNVREIAEALQKAGAEVSKSEINLPEGPIRQIGEYDVSIKLHSDVTVKIKVKIVAEENKT
jgi:large subunit ribosomal protein L9